MCSTFIPVKKPGLLKAFNIKDGILPQNKVLIIKFLDNPNYLFKKTYGTFNKPTVGKKDINRNIIKWDPLEYELMSKDVIFAIKEIVNKRYAPIVNIKFEFVEKSDPRPANVRISFKEKGCWSLIGDQLTVANVRDQDKPTMNFGWFDVGTVLHEFGHVLGLLHEHQSDFSNVIWNKPKLDAYFKNTNGWTPDEVKQQITSKASEIFIGTEFNSTVYDRESIMMYFYPSSVTLNSNGNCCGLGSSENNRLSPLDVIHLNSLYPTGAPNGKYPLTIDEFYIKTYNIPLR